MPHCANCGQEMLENAGFCSACGHPATQTPSVSVSATEPGAVYPAFGDYLKKGWELFKQYPGGFVGFCLVVLGVQAVLGFFPKVGSLASFAVSTPLWMGGFIVSAKLLQGHTPKFGDFFLGFRFFLPLLLVSLVGMVFTVIGLVLLVIPGLYLLVGYLFAYPLVVDRRLDFWPALELSRRTVTPHWFGMFAFLLVLLLINLGGALLLGVGLLITIPVTSCAIAVAYAEIFGLQSRYSEDFPGNIG